jgi:CBS domain-containing protein
VAESAEVRRHDPLELEAGVIRGEDDSHDVSPYCDRSSAPSARVPLTVRSRHSERSLACDCALPDQDRARGSLVANAAPAVSTSRRRQHMRCGDVMKMDIETCWGGDTVQEVAARMRHHNIGFMPVLDHAGRLVGTITDRDITIRVVADEVSPRTPVGHVMSSGVVYAYPDESLRAAEERMERFHKSRIVVVDREGRPIGVISLSDIAERDWSWRSGRVLRNVTDREARA